MTFAAEKVSFEAGGRALLQHVTLRLEPGQVHALIGPNGAGKSTLLRLLAMELTPSHGNVEMNGRPLPFWTPREVAQQRAVLPQSHALAFGFTARQVVALGRLPCIRRRPEHEEAIVREALALAGVAHLIDRSYPTLSGGERARVQLARAMVQIWEPLDGALAGRARYLLLDEPTASLDLAHQHDCLAVVRELAAHGIGVLAVLHDPNLALRYADTVALLRDGRLIATGPPATALTEATLEAVYRVPVRLVKAPGEDLPIVVASLPLRSPANARSTH